MELLTFINLFDSYTHIVIHDSLSNFVVCGGLVSSISSRSSLKKKDYIVLSCHVLENIVHIYAVPN